MINLNLNISKKEAVAMTEEIARVITYVFIYHILTYAIDGSGELFSESSLKMILYLAIAVIIFDLIIRKMIVPVEYQE